MSQPLGIQSIIAHGGPWVDLRISNVTITTSATALPSSALNDRKGLWMFIPDDASVDVYIGDSGVTTSGNGKAYRGTCAQFPFSDQITLYGIVSAGTVTVTIWEFTIA